MLKGSERECLHSWFVCFFSSFLIGLFVLMARSHMASFSLGASSSPLPSFSVVLHLSGRWFSS